MSRLHGDSTEQAPPLTRRGTFAIMATAAAVVATYIAALSWFGVFT